MTGLRLKARLLVPEGAKLVGVMDEFNVLEEGEVFVQVGGCVCRLGSYFEVCTVPQMLRASRHHGT